MKVTINNTEVTVQAGATVLDAAKAAGVSIPTLCHLNLHGIEMINKVGTCRVCMVQAEGRRTLIPACSTDCTEGMVISTNTPRAIKARRAMVELLLSNHPSDCLICARNQNCELQTLAADLGVRGIRFSGVKAKHEKDTSSYSLVRDPEKCVLCRRCETMCNDVQSVGVYSAVNRGFDAVISTAFGEPLIDTVCTFCGQCARVCPTGALTLVNNVPDVWDAINDPDKFVIVQTAPAIRVALGEEFGMPPGASVTGKMAAALRRLGFDKVMDTDFAADLTIMEEATELLNRLNGKGRLPILTSCCPAWVKFIEHQFPELLDIPSTCKSPHEMFGAVAKTYLAEKIGVSPEKIVIVSVMPCLAKKYEAKRPELRDGKHANVDFVLSTRELAAMIREAGVAFSELPDEAFDAPFGESTGASVIFGVSGGVIEAAVRTANAWLNKSDDVKVDFTELRGFDGIRSAKVTLAGSELNIAIASGLKNARKLLEAIRDGKADYHAIEIMACPGGCVGGGGQPYHGNNLDAVRKRAAAAFEEDANKPLRMSHQNPDIKKIYSEFLGEPYSDKAHHLLHTEYTERKI